jgi:hypothetical protein
MVDLRLTVAAGCSKIAAGKIMDLCGVYCPDRIGEMTESRLPCRGRMAALIQIKAARLCKLVSFAGSKSFRAVPL